MKSTVHPCGAVLYEIPRFVDSRGALSVLEIARELPFECRRIFYTYDVPDGSIRGGHAHRQCDQFLVSVAGTLRVSVDNGSERGEFALEPLTVGLYLPAGCWGEQFDHSPGNVLMVLASLPYDNADYIRDYDEFLVWCRGGRQGVPGR